MTKIVETDPELEKYLTEQKVDLEKYLVSVIIVKSVWSLEC